MLVLGHMGITLALAKGVEKYIFSKKDNKFFAIDYRVVLLGSMLPDIIDKPIGFFLNRDLLGAGRTYGHTLFFLLILFLTGIYVFIKSKRLNLLILTGCCFIHYILDSMWLHRAVFFWPILGWNFEKGNPKEWMHYWLFDLFNNPYVYVSEFIGGAIMLYFFINIVKQEGIREFMVTGKLDI